MQMQIDITPFIQAVIALLAALITSKLIPWIKAKTTTEMQKNLTAAARIAVYAAEQIFGAGKGEEKFAYALQSLKSSGYNLDSTALSNSIEKAVLELNLAWTEKQADADPEDPPE